MIITNHKKERNKFLPWTELHLDVQAQFLFLWFYIIIWIYSFLHIYLSWLFYPNLNSFYRCNKKLKNCYSIKLSHLNITQISPERKQEKFSPDGILQYCCGTNLTVQSPLYWYDTKKHINNFNTNFLRLLKIKFEKRKCVYIKTSSLSFSLNGTFFNCINLTVKLVNTVEDLSITSSTCGMFRKW